MTVSADTVRLAMVRETGTPPTPPTTPAMLVARITSESLAFAPTTTTSNELDPSGNIRDSILTGGASTGDIAFEVSDNAWFEEMLAAVFGNDWDGDTLVPDTSLFLYLVEKMFPDVPQADQDSYHRFADSAFVSAAITITPGSPITGTATVNGGPLSLGTVPVSGAVYPDPGTEPVLVPSDATVTIGGIASTACFGTLTLTFDNGTRGIQCIGTLGEKEKVRGRFNATITGQLYYATDDIVHALIDQTEGPVTVELKNSADETEYEFDYPRCKITAAPVVAGGTGTDVVIDFSIQALYDTTTTYTVKVTRGITLLPPETTTLNGITLESQTTAANEVTVTFKDGPSSAATSVTVVFKNGLVTVDTVTLASVALGGTAVDFANALNTEIAANHVLKLTAVLAGAAVKVSGTAGNEIDASTVSLGAP
jgi:Phage tail tube protein